jgi:CheY-like chemotaxis protein
VVTFAQQRPSRERIIEGQWVIECGIPNRNHSVSHFVIEFTVMSNTSKHLILLVDDELVIRESMALLLSASGYDVTTAENGFDALSRLSKVTPDIIISDLNMPRMSGFEFLSVVRRRFPEISVIAISGAYESGDHIPGGVIADAFYGKSRHHPEELLRTIAELIRTAATRGANHQRQSAPVWIPRNGKDSKGVPFIVLSCTHCLRSFPLSVLREGVQEIQQTPCLFCENPVRYIIDFSLAVFSPKALQAAPPRNEQSLVRSHNLRLEAKKAQGN